MKRLKHLPTVWLLMLAIVLFWWLALSSLVDDSPTVDEQNHLARGAAFVRTGDPRLSLEHPPLVNALSALPLLLLPDVKLPLDDASWQRQPPDVYWYRFAEQFLWVYNHDVTRMIFLGRLPIVFLTLGLALLGYHFAGQIWGKPSRIWAFLFLLFDPNVLANGRYTTTDLGGTAFLFLAAFLLWRMWQAAGWNWRRWLWAALGLGLAFGSKLSMLVFVPIFGLLALLPLYEEKTAETRTCAEQSRSRAQRFGGREIWRRFGQFLSAGLLSIGMVWAIFGFEWGPFLFRGDGLVWLNDWRGPMPTFWAGLEQVLNISSGGRPAFLLGHFSNAGFWNYFPVAFLVKTPLVTLLGLVVTAVLFFSTRMDTDGRGLFPARKRALFLLLPAILYFLFSILSALNIGYRHLLPILPFLYVLISGVASGEWQVAGGKYHVSRLTYDASRFTLPVVLLGLLLADLTIYPHFLSYFNWAAGGPENGHNILIDSNIDWGQDLLRLKAWMDENGVESVKLGWFGTAVPAYYGIQYEPIPGTPLYEFYSLWGGPPFDPAAPEPGIYAISVTSLWELPLPDDQKYVYPWFRAREPDDRIGYSILIYDVP
ncbi:MAG: glycosyltransferase family 39 protein [Ardenticatenaceae bacterium]|nr:glycosyltransferase family 39 protein [Ardenticatenaceae bacterium]